MLLVRSVESHPTEMAGRRLTPRVYPNGAYGYNRLGKYDRAESAIKLVIGFAVNQDGQRSLTTHNR